MNGGAPPAAAEKRNALSDDYAATGMGQRQRHDLESADIVKMGISPRLPLIDRREHARGFSSFCPER